MSQQFLWVILPYLCIATFVVGHIFRYRTDQFGWTAQSSEFIEKKQLMVGSILFHVGIMPVIAGHVVGLGIPQEWTRALGVSDEMYHAGALWGGGFFGVMTLLGMIILTARRFTLKSVRQLSSASDMIVNTLLLLIVFLGMYSVVETSVSASDFDYRSSVSIWFRSLLIFRPDASYMTGVPIMLQLHILAGFLITAMWPFTRLVHVWSVPLNYVGRSYILYRRHRK